MKHHFQSVHKSLDLGHHAAFRDGEFATNDDAVAKRVDAHAKAYPREVWRKGQAAPTTPKAKAKRKSKGG